MRWLFSDNAGIAGGDGTYPGSVVYHSIHSLLNVTIKAVATFTKNRVLSVLWEKSGFGCRCTEQKGRR